MQNYNYLPLLLGILIISITVSCSSTSGTLEQGGDGGTGLYPAWYQQGSGIHSDSTRYYAYAAVLAADSATAIRKGIKEARVELQNSVSSRLEEIRNKALSETGSESGLDSPQFILLLRQAEDETGGAAEIGQKDVRRHKESGGFHGFVRVSAGKKELIEALDTVFGEGNHPWEAMKNSEAFKQF